MATKPRAMRDALLEQIHVSMASNPKIFFASADFGSPVLDRIRSDYPRRFVNVGIAEQNLINVSAGLALEGFTVFAYAIAPFITMRCFEQIRVNLALLSEVRAMNVNLIGVGAGYSYVVSGPTHQCYEDITLMRAMPNFQVLSPSDHVSAAWLLSNCLNSRGPKYLRLDAQILPTLYDDTAPDIVAGYSVLQRGTGICLVATGFMVHTALKVAGELRAEGHKVGVVDMFDLARFSRSGLANELGPYSHIVSMEEGFAGRGGLDAMLFDFFSQHLPGKPLLNIGVDGGYRFDLGTREQLHELVGIGPKAALRRIHEFALR